MAGRQTMALCIQMFVKHFVGSQNCKLSADNFSKQFGPRSGLTYMHRAWSGYKLIDTLIIFLKEIFKKVYFDNKSADYKKKHEKFLRGQKVNYMYNKGMKQKVFVQNSK